MGAAGCLHLIPVADKQHVALIPVGCGSRARRRMMRHQGQQSREACVGLVAIQFGQPSPQPSDLVLVEGHDLKLPSGNAAASTGP